MKKFTLLIIWLFLFVFFQISHSQELDPNIFFEKSGEIYFKTEIDHPDRLLKLSKIVSVDNLKGDEVFAYANREEFEAFLFLGLSYTILPKPGETGEIPRMRSKVDIKNVESWDFYPTYEAYLDMMDQFALEYPDICETFSIGQSTNGRELRMLKISDNVSVREAEPQFLYTGTMHGDELAGYVLLLRLADYLLSNYGTDAEVTGMIDNIEIWINPLANPDGTFKGGNHTVFGSTRYNANNVDLNRNYPDPEDGPHPDGKEWQPETLLFMQLANENNFVMSANTHGGAEVLNYPWDTWQHFTADNDWWVFVCREYADTVHQYAPSSYLDGFDNGITNGYAWYSISGGRQDYMNYFHNCREVTIELSNTKKLPESQLSGHWDWNYRSLLNYIQQCRYGVSGVVTDEGTGEPISAKVFIENHDEDNSFVYADSITGFYQRLLETETYDITFSADGYLPVTIQNVEVSRYTTTTLNVQLSSGDLLAEFTASSEQISVGSEVKFTDQSFGNPVSWLWEFGGGNPSTSSIRNPAGIVYQNAGVYDVTLTVEDANGETATLTKAGFIQVTSEYLMSDQTIEVLSGIFYDSGGEANNYSDDEDFTLTVMPAVTTGKIQVDFLSFNIESHSECDYDWLKIYDGVDEFAPFINTWCGTDSPGTVTATNADGALTFVFHSDYNVNLPGWKASLDCVSEQTLMLPGGWSGISLYIEPTDPIIENILSGISDEFIILVGNGGVYYPELSINTLSDWNTGEGYLIKMNTPANLSVSGKNTLEETISLDAGWNYMPVLSHCFVDINFLMAELPDELVVVKEAAGLNIYWPNMGVFTLSGLESGKAYLIFVNNPVDFTFPVCE